MKSNDFSKSSRMDETHRKALTTRVELSQKVWYSSLPSEPLGSPVNPHDVVKGGY